VTKVIIISQCVHVLVSNQIKSWLIKKSKANLMQLMEWRVSEKLDTAPVDWVSLFVLY